MECIQQADFKKAFKDADIRGVYPTEIDERVVYATARAFVEEFKYKKIVVGYDMRLSTPSLKHEFIQGARDGGASVIDIGMVRSPMLYFVSGHLKLPGAVITASHSPAEYNGIKLVAPEAVPLTGKTGLDRIQTRLERGTFKKTRRRGGYKERSFRREYRKYILKNVDRKKYKGIKLAVDIGNGMSGVAMEALDRAIPAKFTLLFKKPDGHFPNRDSDPNLSKSQKFIKAKLKAGRFDFGIAFDGDGDRIAFLDENGKYVNAAVIGAIIAERLLEKEPGAGIVFTNLTSRVFLETIKKCGGKPVRARVGHAFLKEEMRKTGAIFGAEHSGHFFWRDFFNTDSTILTLLAVMDVYSEAKQAGKSFSELVKPYELYKQTEDVVVHVKDKELSLKLVEKQLLKMKPKKITKFDGYFVEFDDVWGAVKPSVTEYAIKLMFESKKKSDAVKVQKEIYEYVKKIANRTK